MSTDYSVYIGPYLKVKNPPKDSTEFFPTCTNRRCRNYSKEVGTAIKFCVECGVKIGRHSRPCETRIEFDVYEKFDERLSDVGCGSDMDEMYLISNERTAPGFTFDPTDHSFLDREIVTDSMKEMVEFEKVFRKEIAALKKVFGDTGVTIHYGVLSWCY